MNFGFLYSGYSRAAFLFFVSTILFSLSLFGKLIGLLMMANALFNVAILIKYPGFDQAQRSDAQNEIQDFLSQHPSYAQSMINVGVNLMTSNNNNNRSAPPSSASQGKGFNLQFKSNADNGPYAVAIGRPVSTRTVGGQPYETIIRV